MSYISHQFRWALLRRRREIIGLFLFWLGFLFLPHRAEHAEDVVIANGVALVGVIAVLGVFLEMLMDTPAMGTNQFWRMRPVTWGKVLITQLLFMLALISPVVAAWAWQCWTLRASVDFLPGAVGIGVLGLVGATLLATVASFAKSRAQFVWVIPVAVGLGWVWWLALLDHGLVALPLGFVALSLIIAAGQQTGKWLSRAGVLLVMLAAVYVVSEKRDLDNTVRLRSQLAKTLQRPLQEDPALDVRDEQGHVHRVLAASTEYSAPDGVVVPVAAQIAAVLPLPTDYGRINNQLGMPPETRWYEFPIGRERGELQLISSAGDPVKKVMSRQRRSLKFGQEFAEAGERSIYSDPRNEVEQITMSCGRWRTMWAPLTERKYFLYSPARSLVVPASEYSQNAEEWLALGLLRTRVILTFYLPPGELLAQGPWRDEEIAGLEIITTISRPCRTPIPLEETPEARTDQLRQLKLALEDFGHPSGDFDSFSDRDARSNFWRAYGKQGMEVLMQASAAPSPYYFELSKQRFRDFTDEELQVQAARSLGWFVNIARAKPKLPLGNAARGLLRAGEKSEPGLLWRALEGATVEDYALITQALRNLNSVNSYMLPNTENLWAEVVKLPVHVYQPAMAGLWKRFGGRSVGNKFVLAAAMSGEIEALDRMVLNLSSDLANFEENQAKQRQRGADPKPKGAWGPSEDVRPLLPEAPKDWLEFFKWYVEHRAQMSWDAGNFRYVAQPTGLN